MNSIRYIDLSFVDSLNSFFKALSIVTEALIDEECKFGLDIKVRHSILKQLTEGEVVELVFDVVYYIEEGDIRLEVLKECYDQIESLMRKDKYTRIIDFSLSLKDSHIKLKVSVVAPIITRPHENFNES